MKNKIIVALILVALIILIAAISFGIKVIRDKAAAATKKYNEDVNALNVEYDKFVSLVGDYNEIREVIKEYREQATYYEVFGSMINELHSAYEQYDEMVNNMLLIVTKLDEICVRTFNDEILNAKCSSYNEIVNTAVAVFIDDVKGYNELVENYNEWILNSGTAVVGEPASKFIPTKINIDVDV